MRCVEGELADELALGAAVALAEGMDGVDLAEIKGGATGEDLRGEVDEESFAVKFHEGVVDRGGYVEGGSEELVALGDVDHAELAGPGEDILKEVVMDSAEVGGGEVAGDALVFKLKATRGYEWGFVDQEFSVVSDAEEVLRTSVAAFGVRVVREAGGHWELCFAN